MIYYRTPRELAMVRFRKAAREVIKRLRLRALWAKCGHYLNGDAALEPNQEPDTEPEPEFQRPGMMLALLGWVLCQRRCRHTHNPRDRVKELFLYLGPMVRQWARGGMFSHLHSIRGRQQYRSRPVERRFRQVLIEQLQETWWWQPERDRSLVILRLPV